MLRGAMGCSSVLTTPVTIGGAAAVGEDDSSALALACAGRSALRNVCGKQEEEQHANQCTRKIAETLGAHGQLEMDNAIGMCVKDVAVGPLPRPLGLRGGCPSCD